MGEGSATARTGELASLGFCVESSLRLSMSVIQSKCAHPERCVIGHPFKPPHIIPLLELVGGAKTSPEAVQRAMASIGKKAIHLRKEVPGHVAYRLQSALYREVLYLIEQGVLSVADADDTKFCAVSKFKSTCLPAHEPERRWTPGFIRPPTVRTAYFLSDRGKALHPCRPPKPLPVPDCWRRRPFPPE